MAFTSQEVSDLSTALAARVTTQLATTGLSKDNAIAAAAYAKTITELSPITGGGSGIVNLTYDATTRVLNANSGGSVATLPLAGTNTAGFMTSAQFQKLALISVTSNIDLDNLPTTAGVTSVAGVSGVITAEQLIGIIDAFVGSSAWRDAPTVTPSPNTLSLAETTRYLQMRSYN